MPKNKTFIGLLIIPVIIFWMSSYQLTPLKFSMILGFIAMIYATESRPIFCHRFLYIAVILGILSCLLKSNTIFYFFSVSILFSIMERHLGRLNNLPICIAIIASPLINNLLYTWSFPIRLQLSQWVASILRLVHYNIVAEGNIIIMEGHQFSVDPACIGLHLVTTSLIIGSIILAYFEKKLAFRTPFMLCVISIGVALILAVSSNFLRLLGLVVFIILPDQALHDIIGLLSILTYVILPFFLLVRWSSKFMRAKYAVNEETIHIILPINSRWWWIIFGGLITMQLFAGYRLQLPATSPRISFPHFSIADIQQEIMPSGVLKINTEDALIYVKPPIYFYQGSHDPRFCWQGSGYSFAKIQIQTIRDKTVYTATLTKGQDVLYTAWWYQSGKHQTPYEWTWRWNTAINGSSYKLINITCTKMEDLHYWIETFEP